MDFNENLTYLFYNPLIADYYRTGCLYWGMNGRWENALIEKMFLGCSENDIKF